MLNKIREETALAIYESNIWQEWSDKEKVDFQLFTDLMVIPFSVFHIAVEKVLGRPVFLHEFTCWDNLRQEYLGERKAPTLDEIKNMTTAEAAKKLRKAIYNISTKKLIREN